MILHALLHLQTKALYCNDNFQTDTLWKYDIFDNIVRKIFTAVSSWKSADTINSGKLAGYEFTFCIKGKPSKKRFFLGQMVHMRVGGVGS